MDLVEGKGLSGQEARKISRECPLLLDLFLYSYLPFSSFVHSEDEASRGFTLSGVGAPSSMFVPLASLVWNQGSLSLHICTQPVRKHCGLLSSWPAVKRGVLKASTAEGHHTHTWLSSAASYTVLSCLQPP